MRLATLARLMLSVGAFLAVVSGIGVWPIILSLLLYEIVELFYDTSLMAAIPDVVEEEYIDQEVGLLNAVNTGAQLVGMLASGAIFAVLGPRTAFASVIVLMGLASVCLLAISVPRRAAEEDPDETEQFLEAWKAGVRFVTARPAIIRICVMAFVMNFALSRFDVLLTAHVDTELEQGPFTYGLINSGLLLGIVVGSLLLRVVSRRHTIDITLYVGFAAMGIAFIFLGLVHFVPLDVALSFTIGTSIGVVDGLVDAWLIRNTPEEIRGRVLSFINSVVTLSIPLSAATLGVTLGRVSTVWLLVATGVLVFSGEAIYWIIGRLQPGSRIDKDNMERQAVS